MSILKEYGLTWWQTGAMGIGFLSLLTIIVVIFKFFFKKFLPALWESIKLMFRK